jgi:dihydropteroate synthase
MNRILTCRDLDEARTELHGVGVSSQGVEVMAPKALGAVIKLTNVRLGAANILKQEMLALGADAAVSRGVVDGKTEISDVILLGSADKLRKLIHKLDHQTIFGLPGIQAFIRRTLPLLETTPAWKITCPHGILDLRPTRVMGILNITPDSFSDGGKYLDADAALTQAKQLVDDGADILDLGGESSRPGSDPVDAVTEWNRIEPVLTGIRTFSDIPVSVDSWKASVIRRALDAGADIVNDITALNGDPELTDLLAGRPDVPVILMHMIGTPRTMQQDPKYDDVVDEILAFFDERLEHCARRGIDPSRVILDPGVGFGKTLAHNLTLLKRCRELLSLGRPVLIGHSRKSFLNGIVPNPPEQRLTGTLAVTAHAFANDMPLVRVHDVKANLETIATLRAVRDAEATWNS